MDSIITQISDVVAELPTVLQFFAVMGIGVVPFLESYAGALVGTVTGVPVVLATAAAIVGNVLAVLVAVWAGSALSRRREARRQKPASARQQKVVQRVDRYGVPVASLLAPTVLAISLTAFVMVTAGLDRRRVLLWQIITVVVWGVAFALIGTGVLTVLA